MLSPEIYYNTISNREKVDEMLVCDYNWHEKGVFNDEHGCKGSSFVFCTWHSIIKEQIFVSIRTDYSETDVLGRSLTCPLSIYAVCRPNENNPRSTVNNRKLTNYFHSLRFTFFSFPTIIHYFLLNASQLIV